MVHIGIEVMVNSSALFDDSLTFSSAATAEYGTGTIPVQQTSLLPYLFITCSITGASFDNGTIGLSTCKQAGK